VGGQFAKSQSSTRRSTGQWTGPVWCSTKLSGAPRCQSSNGQNRQNPNSWVTWLAHRTVSSGAPDCPVRPSTDNLPNGWIGGWGYKYPPTTTTPSIQVFQTSHSIQELVQSIQDIIQRNQSLSKSQIHSKHLVTRERESFARVLWALVLQALVIKARDTNCVVVLVGSKWPVWLRRKLTRSRWPFERGKGLKETRSLWPPQRGLGSQEPNLG
jgi:hypothetical protein